jgi:hypothetical protein
VLRVIKAAQRLGFTLDESPNCWRRAVTTTDVVYRMGWRRAAVKLAEIEAKLADLAVILTISARPWTLAATT